MRMLQVFWNTAFAAVLLGCHQTIMVTAPSHPAPVPTQQVTWANHFLYGFIGRKNVDLRDYCSTSAVESVELSSNATMVAVTIASLGIYCPRRVTVTCTESSSP